MTNIHIAFSHNDFYTEQTVVAMTSIISNKEKSDEITFHIIDGGLSEESKNRLNKVSDCKVEFNSVNMELFKEYKKSDYYPVQMLFTTILPLVVNTDRLIYLDCDMVVNSSLKELWETDFENNYICAVEDVNGKKYIKNFNMNKNSKFFNTGTMLINCKKWLDDDIPNRALKMALDKTGTKWGYDQTVLNILFENKVKFIDLKWNLQYCPINVYPTYSSKKEYKKAIQLANVVHFIGDYKPWKQGYSCFSPKQKDYFKYHQMTEYKWDNLNQWMMIDKILSYRGILAYIKRYPLFLLRKNFWFSIFYYITL